MTISRNQLITMACEKSELRLPAHYMRDAYVSLLEVIEAAILDGYEVRLGELVKLIPVIKPAIRYRNINTGEYYTKPPKMSMLTRLSQPFRVKLNEVDTRRFPNLQAIHFWEGKPRNFKPYGYRRLQHLDENSPATSRLVSKMENKEVPSTTEGATLDTTIRGNIREFSEYGFNFLQRQRHRRVQGHKRRISGKT